MSLVNSALSRGKKPTPGSATPETPPGRFVANTVDADVAVVVVNYNTAHLLERCIGSLRGSIGTLAVQLVIVDNASRDGSVDLVRNAFPDAELIENPTNVGFGRANNQALAYCNARYLLLLNADAFVYPDALCKSVAYMDAQPRCGVLGARLVDEDGAGVFSGRVFPTPWQSFLLQTGLFKSLLRRSEADDAAARHPGARPCDWVVGCYYMIRREVIEQVGLFDPRYFLYFEEVDHCRAVAGAGWRVECLHDARVVHVGGGSAQSEGSLGVGRQISALQMESSLLYFRKHNGVVGLLLAAGLAVATDVVLALKWLVKRRGSGLGVFARRAALVCRLLVQTRAGTRPTR